MANPFNPRVTIAYDLAEDATVSLEVYAMEGTRVRTVFAEGT